MFKLTRNAGKVARSDAAQAVLLQGLRQTLGLEGIGLKQDFGSGELVVKGPLEKYAQPADDFVDGRSLVHGRVHRSFLYFLCRERGEELEPVAVCELQYDDEGSEPVPRFVGVGRSELVEDRDLLANLVDRAMGSASSELPAAELTARLILVPEAYETLLQVSEDEEPSLEMPNDALVYRLNLAWPAAGGEPVELRSLAEVRRRVANLMSRRDER